MQALKTKKQVFQSGCRKPYAERPVINGESAMTHIEEIRKEMKNRGIDLWVARSTDVHGSEYICEHDNVLGWASGFTGDSAVLTVTADEAALWVDGRYFIQADLEMAGTKIRVMKLGEPGVPKPAEWIEGVKASGKAFSDDPELAGTLWKDRPARPKRPIWCHGAEYEDVTAAEKLEKVRSRMKETGSRAVVLKKLDNISWLTNLRGSDIPYNPIFFAFMYISHINAVIFTQKGALTAEAKEQLKAASISVSDYGLFDEFLKDAGKEGLMDEAEVTLLKAIKSDAAISHMKASHVRDGVYVTRFIYRIKQRMASDIPTDEIDAAEMIDSLRAGDERYVSLSFPTIAAYGPNAAMCHYAPRKDNKAVIGKRGFLLVDSGAQYMDGTTDITRTISVGPLSADERKHYTLVMCAMLRLLHARFPDKACGANLDGIARELLWKHDVDFNHGTGHGVAYLGCVHDEPVRISYAAFGKLLPGMVTSDEPGIYIEGKYGIRVENVLAVRRAEDGWLEFENLTWAPLDQAAVNTDYMTDEDISNYNDYQSRVRSMISPDLNEEERNWLERETQIIRRGTER